MRKQPIFAVGSVIGIAAVLFAAFPPFARFVEGAAMDLRRFWWLILLGGLAAWMVWVLRKRNP